MCAHGTDKVSVTMNLPPSFFWTGSMAFGSVTRRTLAFRTDIDWIFFPVLPMSPER
jgi:hypothetical protein